MLSNFMLGTVINIPSLTVPIGRKSSRFDDARHSHRRRACLCGFLTGLVILTKPLASSDFQRGAIWILLNSTPTKTYSNKFAIGLALPETDRFQHRRNGTGRSPRSDDTKLRGGRNSHVYVVTPDNLRRSLHFDDLALERLWLGGPGDLSPHGDRDDH